MYKWYEVRARDTNINKPKGYIITFHVGGESEDHVRHAIAFKGYVDIQYIKEDKDFENNLKQCLTRIGFYSYFKG